MDWRDLHRRERRRTRAAKVGVWPIFALALLSLLPAAALGFVWRWAEDKQTKKVVEATITPELPPALATPVLSLRRAPQTLATVTSEATLTAALTNLGSFLGQGSCLVASLSGRVIVNQAGDTKVIPASNEKLLTAAAALSLLKPDYRFTTRLMGAAAPSGGVISGDVYLVGGGDPLLSTGDYPAAQQYPSTNVTALESLVVNLQNAGVTQITGRVIGDESRYDTERFPAGWSTGIRQEEAGPLGALLVNDGLREYGPDVHVPFQNPAEGAARAFVQLLRNAGITVGGGPAAGQVAPPESVEITSIQSQPLSAVVADMLTNSDDNTAEMLVKEMGYAARGIGSTAEGLQVMREVLVTLGIDVTPLNLVDGSGLDRTNAATCNILLQVLRTKPLADLGVGSMATAGVSGTLIDQFTATPLVGRLHAKTGSLTDVKALTGVVDTSLGPIEFSLVLNFTDADQAYVPVWNQFASAVASYPGGPTVEQLQPR